MDERVAALEHIRTATPAAFTVLGRNRMSRPIARLAPPIGERRWRPPDWDPNAVAADYLLALRERAEAGPLDAEWTDTLLTHLVTELRSAYSPEGVLIAVRNLQPILRQWEQHALDKHAATIRLEESALARAWSRKAARGRLARLLGRAGSRTKRIAKALGRTTVRR
jgi:hypothetical protein